MLNKGPSGVFGSRQPYDDGESTFGTSGDWQEVGAIGYERHGEANDLAPVSNE